MKLNIHQFLYSVFFLICISNTGYSQCIDQNQINNDVFCTANYDPVCGCDGVTYSNSCVAWYHHGVTSFMEGACSGGGGNNGCNCTTIYDPVCGSDGKTYSNSCEAECAGVSWSSGTCESNNDCINPSQINKNVNCSANYDPVCGCDEVTYSNSCVAWYHHGVKSYSQGACSGGGGNNGCNCTTIYDPVCGSDGKTYSNSCLAECAGVSWSSGTCGSNITCKCTNQYASYICDDFQSYTTNAYVSPQSSCWTTWNNREGTSQDARVRRSSSTGNKYLKIDGNTDLVLGLGDKNSGVWDLEFEIWAYRGERGYYNIQHNFRANSSSQWASNVYFDGYGSGRLQVRGRYYTFSYGTSRWITIRQRIDLNSDRTSLYVDGRKVRDWRFSDQATRTTTGIRRLSAINFYSINSNYIFYIDDVKLQRISSTTSETDVQAESRNGSTSANNNLLQSVVPTPKLTVFPNPAHATVNLDIADCANKNTFISIHNMMGQMVYQQSYLATDKIESTVDVSNFSSGAYVVKVKTGDLILSKRLIVNH